MPTISLEQVREAVVFLIALILSVAVHEFGHAFMADRLGDSRPRAEGRVTLNPLAHADPIGTIGLPLFMVLFAPGLLFGWGRPVNINLHPREITRRMTLKTAHMFIALAGPAMNVVLALLVTALLALLLSTGLLDDQPDIANGIGMVIRLNWVLAFFNLIPVAPLDGMAVLGGLLPRSQARVLDILQQYGLYILIGLVVTGAVRYLLWPAQKLWEVTVYLLQMLT